MQKRDRAYRRWQLAKAKRRAIIILRWIWNYKLDEINSKDVGITAAVHGKPCSCTCCGNPRRHFGELTIQERKANLKDKYKHNWDSNYTIQDKWDEIEPQVLSGYSTG